MCTIGFEGDKKYVKVFIDAILRLYCLRASTRYLYICVPVFFLCRALYELGVPYFFRGSVRGDGRLNRGVCLCVLFGLLVAFKARFSVFSLNSVTELCWRGSGDVFYLYRFSLCVLRLICSCQFVLVV